MLSSRTGPPLPQSRNFTGEDKKTFVEKKKKKNSPGEIGCREQADTQTGGPRRLLILLLAHTLFTSSCAPKGIS